MFFVFSFDRTLYFSVPVAQKVILLSSCGSIDALGCKLGWAYIVSFVFLFIGRRPASSYQH